MSSVRRAAVRDRQNGKEYLLCSFDDQTVPVVESDMWDAEKLEEARYE